jgi:hypothetical protein
MGRARSTNGEKMMHIRYWWEVRRKETTRKTKTEVGGQY